MRIPSPFRDRRTSVELQLTPMIDCVFLLMIYFIWSSSFAVAEQLKVLHATVDLRDVDPDLQRSLNLPVGHGALVQDLTDSRFLVSVVMVSFTFPSFLMSPIAGPSVDRFDRKKILVVVSFVQAVAALGLLTVDAGRVWTAFLFQGIMEVLKPNMDAGKIKNVCETFTDGWKPDNAQKNMEQCLTSTNNKVDAVVSENDGMASGVVAALDAQGLAGSVPAMSAIWTMLTMSGASALQSSTSASPRPGMARSVARCSIGWWVGPSSPSPTESWVQT